TIDRRDAGACGSAIQMDRAGPAKGRTASEFRSRHAQHVAQNLEKWCIALNVDALLQSIDFYFVGHDCLLGSRRHIDHAGAAVKFDMDVRQDMQRSIASPRGPASDSAK